MTDYVLIYYIHFLNLGMSLYMIALCPYNSIHRFLHGLLGSLIPFDTHAFVPQRQSLIVTRLRHFATSRVSKYCYTPLVVFVTPF